MDFGKQDLDLVLVPSGLLIMFTYHLFLLYRYLQQPHTTVMGFENHTKKAWVQGILKADRKDIGSCLSVISTNVSAATFLATVSLTLSSLIGAWISNSTSNFFQSELIYGDRRPTTISIKYVSLLVCFLLSFCCFIQSARHFVHGNYLISIPNSIVPGENVETAILRAGDFWSAGLRALYFAVNLLFWFFGPIPMVICSIVMVTTLHYLDSNTAPLIEHQFVSASQVVKRVEQRVSEVAEMAIHVHHRD